VPMGFGRAFKKGFKILHTNVLYLVIKLPYVKLNIRVMWKIPASYVPCQYLMDTGKNSRFFYRQGHWGCTRKGKTAIVFGKP